MNNSIKSQKSLKQKLDLILSDLFKYEKHFYKTGKKSDFNIMKYYFIFHDDIQCNSDIIDCKLKVYSKYSKTSYYILISEILDRLINVNLNFDIKTIVYFISFDIKVLYYFRNTSIFLMISDCLTNIDIMKQIFSLQADIENCDPADIVPITSNYLFSNYINVYLSAIINNILDNKLINSEIDIFKKIIDNMYYLNFIYELIETAHHLLYYKYKFENSNNKSGTKFCNILLNYIKEDFNLIETIEYKDDLEFLISGIVYYYYNNLDDQISYYVKNVIID